MRQKRLIFKIITILSETVSTANVRWQTAKRPGRTLPIYIYTSILRQPRRMFARKLFARISVATYYLYRELDVLFYPNKGIIVLLVLWNETLTFDWGFLRLCLINCIVLSLS